jgi:hypothetical protein
MSRQDFRVGAVQLVPEEGKSAGVVDDSDNSCEKVRKGFASHQTGTRGIAQHRDVRGRSRERTIDANASCASRDPVRDSDDPRAVCLEVS